MRKKKGFILIMLVLLVVIGGAYALYNSLGGKTDMDMLLPPEAKAPEASEQESSAPSEGRERAKDFTAQDADGNEVKLSDYFGKPIVLNFWASWCGPCRSEMPDFNEKYKELGDDVQFLMVNMTEGFRETLKSAKAYIEESGFSFPVLFDTGKEAAMNYSVYALPTTFFIDAEGNIVSYAKGAIDSDTLQKGIDMICE